MKKMKNRIVVYTKDGGFPYSVVFLGNQWWIVTKDEPLVPLFEERVNTAMDYCYLCEQGEPILMKDLAGMIGRSLEMPEEDIRVVMTNRLKELNNMGVTFQAVPQQLKLKINIFANKYGKRQGKYILACEDTDRGMMYFNIDGFDDVETALQWYREYSDFFMKHGVRVNTTLECTEEIYLQLKGNLANIKVEIEEEL